MKRDALAEGVYRAAIRKFPKFPFGYYFLSLCLLDRDDSEWRIHAQKAVNILLKTTVIDGHAENHDEVLGKLKVYLGISR